jgi:hypothetical protein
MKEILKKLQYSPAAILLAVNLISAPIASVAYAQTAPATAQASATLSESTIKALQEALSKQGIAVKADGVMNDETRSAIRKYQSQHHLPVTGEADKATLDKLGVAVQSGAAPSTSSTVGQASTPSTGSTASPQAPMQSGQGPGGMMMSGPMMQEMMQGMMKTMQGMMGMMQGQMQSGQMQPGQMQPGRMQRGPMQGAQGGAMMNCPMMPGSDQSGPAMMQMMQGMMQMMNMMQNQMPSGQRP